MVYLITSIFFLALTLVIFRIAGDRGADGLGLAVAFRLFGGVIGIVLAVTTLDVPKLMPMLSTIGWFACVAAVLYWLAGFANIRAFQTGHMATTSTVNRLAMVMPTVASVLYWQEIAISPVSRLLVLRGLGILTAVVAVVLLGIDRLAAHRRRRLDQTPELAGKPLRPWLIWLGISFLAQGLWEVSLRATTSLNGNEERFFFLTVVFILAMFMSLPVAVIFRPRLGRLEFKWGAIAAASAMLGTSLRPWALLHLDGVIVFPMTTIGVLLLLISASVLIWKERMGPWGIIGVTVALGAIVLLVMR